MLRHPVSAYIVRHHGAMGRHSTLQRGPEEGDIEVLSGNARIRTPKAHLSCGQKTHMSRADYVEVPSTAVERESQNHAISYRLFDCPAPAIRQVESEAMSEDFCASPNMMMHSRLHRQSKIG
jgi:hypothetical protein